VLQVLLKPMVDHFLHEHLEAAAAKGKGKKGKKGDKKKK
jgi:hypothetical protein